MKDSPLKIHRIAIFAVVLAVNAGFAAAEYKYIAAGNKEALWLVRVDAGAGKFDLLTRPAGKKWRWVTDDMTGVPAAAAAVGGRVLLLLPDPYGYLIFHASDDRPSQGPPANDAARWPRGEAPLAACQANRYAAAEMLVLVAGNGGETGGAPTKPATGPVITNGKQPNRLVTLSLFGNAEKKWTYLAEIKNVRLSEETAVYLVSTGDAAYVLITDESQSKLTIIRNDSQQEVSMPSGAKPVGMITTKTGVIVVRRSTEEGKSGQLSLAIFEGGKFSLKQVTDNKKPFAPAETPMIAQLGGRIAMLWKDGGRLMLATCERTGVMNLQETIGILDKPATDTNGQNIMEYFLWSVLIATFLSMLLVRRRSPTKPFMLPAGMMTGNLLKRLAAGLIDIIPFFITASIILYNMFPSLLPEKQPQSFDEAVAFAEKFNNSAPAAYASIAALLGYTVYCILMEWRFGATVGKMLMRLRVVGDSGKPVAMANIIMRNVFRILELSMTPFQLVLLLIPLITSNRQRLGDILARTTVVQTGFAITLPPPPPRQEEPEDSDDRDDDGF